MAKNFAALALATEVSENFDEIMVEAAGVEPASAEAFEPASTRVGTPFEVSHPPMTADLRVRRVS